MQPNVEGQNENGTTYTRQDREEHPFPQRVSNPRSQQSSGFRPTA